jgi:acetyltransferase-like isoleucine patch superfamily enzyme
MIGAGSVVKKDVPTHSIVVVYPAKILKTQVPGTIQFFGCCLASFSLEKKN